MLQCVLIVVSVMTRGCMQCCRRAWSIGLHSMLIPSGTALLPPAIICDVAVVAHRDSMHSHALMLQDSVYQLHVGDVMLTKCIGWQGSTTAGMHMRALSNVYHHANSFALHP